MIKNIIDLLNLSDYYGVSKRIDIAKGRHQLPISWKDGAKNIKRRIWQRKLK
jgi:hypothetical protein